MTKFLERIKVKYPKVYAHLVARSREAELNTGDPAGEYGTWASIQALAPSKQEREIEHALVHSVAVSLGPDMAYNRTGRLVHKVREACHTSILSAFESGKLTRIVEPFVSGPASDRWREDRYY